MKDGGVFDSRRRCDSSPQFYQSTVHSVDGLNGGMETTTEISNLDKINFKVTVGCR